MTLTKIASTGVEDSLRWVLGANGTSDYTFTGPGLNGTVNDPTIYLTRGHTYIFQNNSGGHPFYIKTSTANGGTNDAYNTGVTNNGGGNGTEIVFTVPHDSPDILYYQCSSHAAMNGQFNIAGSVADGSISTAKIADDAVTDAKLANSINAAIAANTAKTTNATHTGDVTGSTSLTIANDAVTAAKIANGAVETNQINAAAVTDAKIANGAVSTNKINAAAVTTAKIADEAVTLAKLEHGTSSNDGKFLRANNGADPTFETVSGTTINSNADNRVITGSGTANTLNAESEVLFDATTSDFSIIGSQASRVMDLIVQNTHNGGAAAGARLTLESGSNANTGPQLGFRCGTHTWYLQVPKAAGNLEFNNNDTGLNFLMADDGDFHIVDGDLVFSTAGHGIDFSATSDVSGATNELLADYEEGSFSPSFNMTSSSPNITYYDQQGQYTRVGRVVHVQIYLRINVVNSNGSGILFIDGLPFTAVSNTGQGPAFGCATFGYMDTIQGMGGTDSPVGYFEANANRIYLYVFPDSSGHAQNMNVANNLTNNSKMMLSGSYQI